MLLKIDSNTGIIHIKATIHIILHRINSHIKSHPAQTRCIVNYIRPSYVNAGPVVCNITKAVDAMANLTAQLLDDCLIDALRDINNAKTCLHLVQLHLKSIFNL